MKQLAVATLSALSIFSLSGCLAIVAGGAAGSHYGKKKNIQMMRDSGLIEDQGAVAVGIQLDADLSITSIERGRSADYEGVEVGSRIVAVGGYEVRDLEDARYRLFVESQERDSEIRVVTPDGQERLFRLKPLPVMVDDDAATDLGIKLADDLLVRAVQGHARRAGVLVGDRLVGVEGRVVANLQEAYNLIALLAGSGLDITIERNGIPMDVHITRSTPDHLQ